MNTDRDLQFKALQPLFGIRACSNIFSGAEYDLQGEIFKPPLKRLTDRILTQWYFKHYNHEDDVPLTDLFRTGNNPSNVLVPWKIFRMGLNS